MKKSTKPIEKIFDGKIINVLFNVTILRRFPVFLWGIITFYTKN